jgi:hypothetical protein
MGVSPPCVREISVVVTHVPRLCILCRLFEERPLSLPGTSPLYSLTCTRSGTHALSHSSHNSLGPIWYLKLLLNGRCGDTMLICAGTVYHCVPGMSTYSSLSALSPLYAFQLTSCHKPRGPCTLIFGFRCTPHSLYAFVVTVCLLRILADHCPGTFRHEQRPGGHDLVLHGTLRYFKLPSRQWPPVLCLIAVFSDL